MDKIPPWLLIAGAILIAIALTTGTAVTADYLQAAWMASSNAQKWAPYLAAAENAYGIPSGLLNRIAFQESSFDQDVIDGTRPSKAGALGMMQLMPQYFQSVNVPRPFSDVDTQAQIVEAASFLAGLYGHFSDWTAAVAAYNAGQGNINKVLAGTMTLPAETANYIAKISADLPGIVNPTLSA